MVDKFDGKVIWHPDFRKVVESNPKVKQVSDDFRDYWETGFNPSIGKDYVMQNPASYGRQAIGHAHIKPSKFTKTSSSSSAQCWYDWANGGSFKAPTSNSLLVYCVDIFRNACLLSYLDGNSVNSHDVLLQPSYRASIVVLSQEYYAASKTRPLSKSDFLSLFSDKWL